MKPAHVPRQRDVRERVPSPSPASASAERIAAAFAAARREGRRAALMPFLMGGFPTLDGSRAIGEAYADGGADIVELGIPAAHPHADGPVIRAAGASALRAGASVEGVLGVARELSRHVPVVVMCYAAVVRTRGAKGFARALRDTGVSGLIVPDLVRQEAAALLAACDAAGVELVPLIAPPTDDDCVAALVARARGFVYVASVGGATGERAVLDPRVASRIRRVQRSSTVPAALGFGISTPAHAAEAATAGADGVIVGSRLVRATAEAADPPAAVRELVAGFSAALRGGDADERWRAAA